MVFCEYKVETVLINKDDDPDMTLENFLNDWSKEGWRFRSVTPLESDDEDGDLFQVVFEK